MNKKKAPKNNITGTTSSQNKGHFLTPLGDKVLIEITEQKAEQQTSFGMILPESVSKEKSAQGNVIAVGAGKVLENGSILSMNVEVGDRVLFSKYGYDEIEMNHKKYVVISESQILGILR